MYAVVKTGGKQYRVAKDDKIIVDHINAQAGDNIVLDQVLMMDDGNKTTVGKPLVNGAAVGATVLKQTKSNKIMVFKHKRRKNFRRTKGHRQDLTLLQINDIAPDGKVKIPSKTRVEKTKVAKTKTETTKPKTESKKTETKKAAAKKAIPKKNAAKKTTAKKENAKKTPPKKTDAKKTTAKAATKAKTTTKKSTKKATAKKTTKK